MMRTFLLYTLIFANCLFVHAFQSISVERLAKPTRDGLWSWDCCHADAHKMKSAVVLERRTTTSLEMCICINCARVTNCEAYHFVETKHDQPHMTENPTFTPRDGSPTIHANIRMVEQNEVMDRLYMEHQAEEEQAALAAASESNNQEEKDSSPLVGKTVYDLSSATTIEYDVVACEDFIEDKGCWYVLFCKVKLPFCPKRPLELNSLIASSPSRIRNMPEEIKLANPNFVPT